MSYSPSIASRVLGRILEGERERERERERESRICVIVDRYTRIQCHVYYMHFILLFLLLLLQCMLLEFTHGFVALNMHENQQHPPHLNKLYNYASTQSGISIAFSIRCLLTWRFCGAVL